jgi:ribosome biogenesis GTPase
MPDLRAALGHCRFYNCTHLHEPGCGVRDQVEGIGANSSISAQRYKLYQGLFEELSQRRFG